MVEEMEDMGLDTSEVAKRPVKRARSRVSERAEENGQVVSDVLLHNSTYTGKAATIKRNKTHSRKPQKDTANLSPALQKKAREASQVSQRRMAFTGQKGEGDRYATASLQKYLNSGKRKNGTHYSR